jgi:hypothetical protein
MDHGSLFAYSVIESRKKINAFKALGGFVRNMTPEFLKEKDMRNAYAFIRIAALAAGLLGVGGMAQAAVLSCPASFVTDPDAKVENADGTMTAASDCQYISPADTNNVASVENINAAGFFGPDDWSLNGANGQVTPGAGGLSGTWSIFEADFTSFAYMIVFKDGSDTNLIGFLLNGSFANGVWSSPFTNPPFNLNEGQVKGVSHYTIVQRAAGEEPCDPQIEDCGPNEVPEPGSLALMSLGMVAGAYFMKRRRTRRPQ